MKLRIRGGKMIKMKVGDNMRHWQKIGGKSCTSESWG